MKQLIPIFTTLLIAILSVGVQGETSVDAHSLSIDNGKINFYITNLGGDEAEIHYTLMVAGSIIQEADITIAPHSETFVEKSYAFTPGVHNIRIEVYSNETLIDYEELIHHVLTPYACHNPYGVEGQWRCNCNTREYFVCREGNWRKTSESKDDFCFNCGDQCGPKINAYCAGTPAHTFYGYTCTKGFTDTYRCVAGVLERLYQHYDCRTEWVEVKECALGCRNEKECNPECIEGWVCTPEGNLLYRNSNCTYSDTRICEYGCNNGVCRPPCGVEITVFDYENNLLENEMTQVYVEVTNAGKEANTITLEFFVDGKSAGTYTKKVGRNEIIRKTFYYQTGKEGFRSILVKAETENGCEDMESARVTVNTLKKKEPIRIPSEENKKPTVHTDVAFHPDTISIEKFTSRAIEIEISSETEQTFLITVSGVPKDWVNFDSQIILQENSQKTVYIYLTGKETGTHEVHIRVIATQQGLIFEKTIKLFVAPPEKGPSETSSYADISDVYFAFLIVSLLIVTTSFIVFKGYIKTKPIAIGPKGL